MNQKQMEEFRVLLKKRLQEIKTSHDEHRKALPSMKDRTDIQSGDLGLSRESDEVEGQVILNDEYYMEKITKALQRIDSGTYGKCEWCNEAIPLERLQAKPSVSLCLKCQEKKDEAG